MKSMKPTRLAWMALLFTLPHVAFGQCAKANFPPVDIETYYKDAIGKSGPELKSALNEIVPGNHPYS